MSDGRKFSHRYDRAILALLSEPTLDLAAKKAGIGAATLARWLQRADFQEAYRVARRQTFEAGLSRLQVLIGEAISALQKNLTCGKPVAEIRAAVGILDHARYGAEFLDLAERLTALEQLQEDHASHS